MALGRQVSHLDELQNNNRALVMKAIANSSCPTRTTLTNATGLNRATITNIVSDLIGYGLLEEGEPIVRSKGRRPMLLSFSDECFRMVGVRITRAYFVAGIYGLSQKRYGGKRVDFSPGEPAKSIQEKILLAIQELKEQERGRQLLGIGISMPGPVALDGSIATPIVDFPGWERHDVKALLTQAFDLPVLVEKDANAAALMEWYTRAKSDDIVLYLDMGHGIGSALVLGGELYKGALGGAGEIGHSYLQADDGNARKSEVRLEQYCTTPYLMSRLRQRMPGEDWPVSWHQVVEAFHGGNDRVAEMVYTCAEAAGVLVAYLINLMNPHTVVVAGEMADLGQPYLDALVRSARDYTLPALFANTAIEFPWQRDRQPCGAGANLVWNALLHDPGAFLQ